MMRPLMRFPSAVRRDPVVQAWLDAHADALGAIARQWFEALRRCGGDVRELLHDGMPTACVGDAAFAYVNAFRAHVNVGFFCGAELPDPAGLLQGTGRFMRHVKLRPDTAIDEAALTRLIEAAHADAKARLQLEDAMPHSG
ncbi:DUF1801 domain-containing protein [Roseateles sp.]|uniref:DUF1801 domain-containing protein n=1 Tax=Roseateles sp. TaxID=1971397 RepID=UPI0039ECC503